MSFQNLHPIYVSLNSRNVGADYDLATTADDASFYASASLQTNVPILDRQSNYVCAVERMELSLNGIPFYDASTDPNAANRESIYIRSRLNPLLLSDPVEVDLSAYSLSHLFEILNSYDYVNPNDDSVFNMTFSISKDGFIVMSLLDGQTFTSIQVELPRRLNMILGLSISEAIQQPGTTAAASSFPRVDLGDDLDHIILRTDLPTISDQAGNFKLHILTDFAPPSSYSNSLAYGADGNLIRSGFSTNLRQKAIYIPSERRYLDLVGDFPLQSLTVDAFYANQDEELKRIILPFGASFELKLGFYRREAE